MSRRRDDRYEDDYDDRDDRRRRDDRYADDYDRDDRRRDDRYEDDDRRRDEPEEEQSDELAGHSGDPLPHNADFFVMPPEEIGALSSAGTTLREGQKPMAPGLRAFVIIAATLAGLLIGVGIDLLAGLQPGFWYFAWPIGLSLIALAICWFSTTFEHTCTYVGREGAARFVCSGQRDHITTNEVFLFRDATELRTSQVRRYKNGVYQGTDYTYTWTDVGGRTRFVVGGTHNSEQGNPHADDLYHFATASELAWSMSLLPQAERKMTMDEEIRFSLGGKDWVAVGAGYLRLNLGGEITDCDTEDIRSVSITNGTFTVKRKDAKEGWFTSRGVFKFDYSKLANAQLFMFVLDKLAGIQIE